MLFTAFGSAGDLIPVMSIAKAAVLAGHECLAVVNPAQSHFATLRGVAVRLFGEPWTTAAIAERPAWLHARHGSLRMLRELMAPQTRALVPALRAACDAFEPDVVVHHQASFGVPWVTDPAGVPRVMVAVAPASWPSIEDPNLYPPMPDRDRYPAWTLRLGASLGRRSVNRAIDPVLNDVRRELGLPPKRAFMFDEQPSGALNLGMWSPHYRGPASDDPPNAVIVGFPKPDRHALDADAGGSQLELERFERWREASGDGPDDIVAMSLGTTATYAGIDQHALTHAIVERADVRMVVLSGLARDSCSDARRLSLKFVPHDAVFPRCSVVIHHGGIGTVGRTLAAGAVSVTCPFTHDQPDNARRLRRLGVSVTVKPRMMTAKRLAEAIDCVRQSSSANTLARAFAQRVRKEDGGAAAVAAIRSACR